MCRFFHMYRFILLSNSLFVLSCLALTLTLLFYYIICFIWSISLWFQLYNCICVSLCSLFFFLSVYVFSYRYVVGALIWLFFPSCVFFFFLSLIFCAHCICIFSFFFFTVNWDAKMQEDVIYFQQIMWRFMPQIIPLKKKEE